MHRSLSYRVWVAGICGLSAVAVLTLLAMSVFTAGEAADGRPDTDTPHAHQHGQAGDGSVTAVPTETDAAVPSDTPVPEGAVIDLDPEVVYSMTDPKRPPFVLSLSPEMGTVTLPTGWDMGLSMGMALEEGKIVPYSAYDFHFQNAVIIVDLRKGVVESTDLPEGMAAADRHAVDDFIADIEDGK